MSVTVRELLAELARAGLCCRGSVPSRLSWLLEYVLVFRLRVITLSSKVGLSHSDILEESICMQPPVRLLRFGFAGT